MCVHFCQFTWIFFIWNLQGFSPSPFVLNCFWPILFLQNFMKSKVWYFCHFALGFHSSASSLCTFHILILISIWFPSAGHTWSIPEWKANVKTNLFLDFVTAGSLVHLNTRGHHNCQIYFKSNSNQTEKFTFDKIN